MATRGHGMVRVDQGVSCARTGPRRRSGPAHRQDLPSRPSWAESPRTTSSAAWRCSKPPLPSWDRGRARRGRPGGRRSRPRLTTARGATDRLRHDCLSGRGGDNRSHPLHHRPGTHPGRRAHSRRGPGCPRSDHEVEVRSGLERHGSCAFCPNTTPFWSAARSRLRRSGSRGRTSRCHRPRRASAWTT